MIAVNSYFEDSIPKTQTAGSIQAQGVPIKLEFDSSYPVPEPGPNEVLVKVLYTGVCQSDLHTAAGTATGADGKPITNIKFPHIGGHEGVGRIVKFGPQSQSEDNASPSSSSSSLSSHSVFSPPASELQLGQTVGIRFVSRVCHECDFCTTDREQHCAKQLNHLHHEDGSFQEYCVLDMRYLTMISNDLDPKVVGPVLCAGVTAYRAVLNANLDKGSSLVVFGAGGGLGHFAVQYGLAVGVRVIGVDKGAAKGNFIRSLGADFVDFAKSNNLVEDVKKIAGGDGAHAAIVTSGHPRAFSFATDVLGIGGTLCCIGIPPGDVMLPTPIATIVIKGLRILGNLVGSMKDTTEALEFVQKGLVRPQIEVRPFRDLPKVYEMLENGDVLGRVVLKIAEDD